ncbi:hypothetical protein H6G33_37495 [Calothrix sp. FACHB-1219]|uniref:hypothetical protein n=1 Tax=unclassified Calothrix TaxID=2619626 RepID=UPI00168557F8|nr:MULTISPECIES: hypothetical protein [unclassified Calothrix]MBD2208086.1 hypothetical protein [Calothrix sp. FACHB-168]MBD2222624.1 hypothetical protein [Calothrix sp. FACHB-1219]
MISQTPIAKTKDLDRVQCLLIEAETALGEAYALVLKLKISNQIVDERIITNLADAWHYSTEALNNIEA